jgi:hypothetical protein
MRPVNSLPLLRFAVAFDFLATVAPLVLELLQVSLLPTTMLVAGRDLPKSLALSLLALDVLYLVILLIAWIGLLRRRRYARPLYLLGWVISLILAFIHGDDALTGTASILQLMVGFSGGFLVAVIYLSEARLEFTGD